MQYKPRQEQPSKPQYEEKKWDDDPVVDQLKKMNFNLFKIRRMMEEQQPTNQEDPFNELVK